MRTIQTVVLALAIALLAGCGFQLRGTGTNAAVVEQVAWRLQDGSLAGESIARTLTGSGVVAFTVDPERPLIVELRRVLETRRAVSVNELAREAEQELLSTLVYAVVDGQGTIVRAETRISELRIYLTDRDNIMGSVREEELLRREMREQLAYSLLRVLGTL